MTKECIMHVELSPFAWTVGVDMTAVQATQDAVRTPWHYGVGLGAWNKGKRKRCQSSRGPHSFNPVCLGCLRLTSVHLSMMSLVEGFITELDVLTSLLI
jgi:hypothetical protein